MREFKVDEIYCEHKIDFGAWSQTGSISPRESADDDQELPF